MKRVHIIWTCVALVAVAVTWACALIVLKPAVPPSADEPPPTIEVRRGDVGETQSTRATLTFDRARGIVSGAGGVLTALPLEPGEELEAGTTIATLDLRPIIVMQGTTPAFRDLAQGVRGPDVAQLRAFLALPQGDLFDATTTGAVRAWQERSGFVADGVVRLGDVAFLPQLPARGFADPALEIGGVIAPGQEIFTIVENAPAMRIPADQQPFGPGMGLTVSIEGGELEGVLVGPFTEESGLTTFLVEAPDGGPLCSGDCAAAFPVTSSTQLAAEVAVVPAQEGLVVPTTALVARPDGGAGVRLADGDVVDVDVTARDTGLAIIEGVEEGTVVELFPSDASPAQQDAG